VSRFPPPPPLSRFQMAPLLAAFAATAALALAPAPAARAPALVSPRAASPTMLASDDRAKLVGLALAGLLAFGPIDDASAARSGSRVGGRAPVSRSAPSRSAPAPQHTNVYIAPAPVYGGGYGYGYGGGGGFFGGGISTGAYLGLSLVDTLIREQQRQAYLQQQLRTQQELGKDQAMIAQLQAELAAQNAKVEGLRAQQQQQPATAQQPVAQNDNGAMSLLQQQLLEQQKQIELLKASK